MHLRIAWILVSNKKVLHIILSHMESKKIFLRAHVANIFDFCWNLSHKFKYVRGANIFDFLWNLFHKFSSNSIIYDEKLNFQNFKYSIIFNFGCSKIVLEHKVPYEFPGDLFGRLVWNPISTFIECSFLCIRNSLQILTQGSIEQKPHIGMESRKYWYPMWSNSQLLNYIIWPIIFISFFSNE